MRRFCFFDLFCWLWSSLAFYLSSEGPPLPHCSHHRLWFQHLWFNPPHCFDVWVMDVDDPVSLILLVSLKWLMLFLTTVHLPALEVSLQCFVFYWPPWWWQKVLSSQVKYRRMASRHRYTKYLDTHSVILSKNAANKTWTPRKMCFNSFHLLSVDGQKPKTTFTMLLYDTEFLRFAVE